MIYLFGAASVPLASSLCHDDVKKWTIGTAEKG